MSITAIAVKRPLLIVVIFTVLALFGVQSYLKLNYNLLPTMDIPTVSVSAIYRGASAGEVETSVTKKLEDAFASIEGLETISSSSQEGVSQITITLKSGTDIDEAERNIQRKADQIQKDLPKDLDPPTVQKVNLEELPVIKAGITSDLSPKALYQLVDQQLLPILQNVDGVGQVNIIGGDEREVQINIDREKLNFYALTITQVSSGVAAANQSFPAGQIKTAGEQLSIQYDANISSLDQLRSLIIKQLPDGGNVLLRDIAEVVDATAESTAINHINGQPSIGVQIIKQSDANAVNVSRGVKKAFDNIEKQYAAKKLKFVISTDQSTYTLHAGDEVMFDLMLAVLIVGLVMLAFLHSFRSSMFVMVALPSSIIPTFIAMYVMGFSLNLMTLMAMSLVVGILVDDSIVVLENIYRHLEMGKNKRTAALEGRNEIGFTALSITLVDVVVFLPLALSSGLIGSILKEFSLVVVISTLMSLFVSFTITPLLASRFGKIEELDKKKLWGRINLGFEGMIDQLKTYYGEVLGKVLHKKRWLFSLVIMMLVGSIMLVAKGFIGSTFIPTGDQGELLVSLELAPSTSLYQTNMTTEEVEKIILSKPEVKNVFSSIGFVSGSVSGSSNNSNMAELTISLVDGTERTVSSEEFGIKLKKELSETIPGIKVSASPTSITGQGSQAAIQVTIKGIDLKTVRKVAEQYKALIATVPGTQSVELSVKDQKQQIEVELNREKMAVLGLDASLVGNALQNAFSGNSNAKYKENGNEYDILINLDQFDRSDISNVSELSFTSNKGQNFTLSQFATVSVGMGETVRQRINRLNSITVQSQVVGRPVGTVADEVKEKLSKTKIPPGIAIQYEGDIKNQGDAFGSLGIALLTAIILVYLIMVALYESLLYPFVVLFSIPVALIGALLALALTMETLNVFSIIGMIMLMGLVAKNGILIVDFTNQLKAEGLPVEKALNEAGRERLRPILMTTLAMILGMLPIAMASGPGSEVKNGMAWVIIGGLTSSMILTLFVVPSMYLIVEKIKMRSSKRSSKHWPH